MSTTAHKVINISATLKIAKYFTLIKSTTFPIMMRSIAFATAPEITEVYAIFAMGFWRTGSKRST